MLTLAWLDHGYQSLSRTTKKAQVQLYRPLNMHFIGFITPPMGIREKHNVIHHIYSYLFFVFLFC